MAVVMRRLAAASLLASCSGADLSAPAAPDSSGTLDSAEPPPHRFDPGSPLASWLDALNFPIDDIEQRTMGLTLKANSIVCTHIAVERAMSDVHLPTAGQSEMVLSASGLNIDCTGDWSAGALHGAFRVGVGPLAQVKAVLGFPISDTGVPYEASVVSCSTALDLHITISNCSVSWILNALLGILKPGIQHNIKNKLCGALRDFTQNNLTEAVKTLNEAIEPPHVASSDQAATNSFLQEAAATGSLDWTTVDLLKTIGWVTGDLLTEKDINRAFKWATSDTGTIQLPGLGTALVDSALDLGGSPLGFAVGLRDVTITGVDGINTYQPITAVSPSELYSKLVIGTPERRSMTLSGSFIFNLTSSDATVVEPLQLSVGLTEPAMDGRVKLVVRQGELPGDRSAAQWLYGTEGCLQDALLESPRIEDLNVSITGVSSPLTFTSQFTGHLEGDLATLANNVVHWFNQYYLRFLPNFIRRTSTSAPFINKVNDLLAGTLQPTPAGQTSCISEKDAAAKVKELVPQFANWSELLGGPIRESVDMIADAFFAVQNSSHVSAVSKLQALAITTTGGEIDVAPKALDFAGMSSVKKLRLALPEPNVSTSLNNILNISCEDYRGSMSGSFDVSAKSRNVSWHPSVEYSLPCGEMDVHVHVKLDMHRALSQKLSSNLACLAAPFTEVSLQGVHGVMRQWLDLAVKLRDDRPLEKPLVQLCADYPKVCDRLRRLEAKEQASGWAGLNSALSALLDEAGSACTSDISVFTQLLGGASDVAASNALGDGKNLAVVVMSSLVVSAIFAAATIYCVGTSAASAVAAGRTADASMAVRFWASGKHRDRAQVVALTSALAFALVLRTVGLFFLDAADAVARVNLDGMGGIGELKLITFSFPSMVAHYWEATAYFSATLLVLMSGVVAYGVIFGALLAWLVPMSVLKTKCWLRISMALARFPFVDVVFFGHLIPVLNKTLSFPMGLSLIVENSARVGIFVNAVSAVLAIVAVNRMHGFLPATAAQRSKGLRPVTFSLGGLATVGVVLWLTTSYFHVDFLEIAGDLMSAAPYSGASVIRSTISESAILGSILVLMLVLAPLVQVVGAATGQQGLRKWGDAFFLFDVFAGGFFAVISDVNGIAKWIFDNRFHKECSLAQSVSGAGCIGLEITPMLAGSVGLLLAVIGCVGLMLFNIVDDLRSTARQPLLEAECCEDASSSRAGSFAQGQQPSSAELA